MRKIKFKQPILNKDGSFKEWFYWGFIGEQNEFITPHSDYRRCSSHQFTGILDKNGKEIYEWDACRIRGGEQYQGYTEIDITGIIKFGFGSFNLVTKNEIHYSFDQYDSIEILGNIHENPELLNKLQ